MLIIAEELNHIISITRLYLLHCALHCDKKWPMKWWVWSSTKKTFITVTIFTSSVTSEQFGALSKVARRALWPVSLHGSYHITPHEVAIWLRSLGSPQWPVEFLALIYRFNELENCAWARPCVCVYRTDTSEFICHKHTHFMTSREYRNCLCTHIRLWWGIAMTRGLRIAKPLKEAFFLNHINTYNTHVLVSLQFLNELNWLNPPLKWSPVISFWFIGKSPSFLGPRVLLSQHLLFW